MPESPQPKRSESTAQLSNVNQSGFPFQLAVEELIRRHNGDPRWRLVTSEMPAQVDFIDLVARCGPLVAVIECKRVQDKSWTFLIDNDDAMTSARARVHRFGVELGPAPGHPGFRPRIDCAEVSLAESSPEARYCVTARSKDEAVRELETHARRLVDASLAIADGRHVNHASSEEFFLPIIVTTAKLFACRFDRSMVNLNTGFISDAKVEAVDIIRFRKPLAVELGNTNGVLAMGLDGIARHLERTVFVVSPDGLTKLFSGARVAHVIESDGTRRRIV